MMIRNKVHNHLELNSLKKGSLTHLATYQRNFFHYSKENTSILKE